MIHQRVWQAQGSAGRVREVHHSTEGELSIGSSVKMAIEIVDFPIKNGGSFHSYVNVYQRVGDVSSFWRLEFAFCTIHEKGDAFGSPKIS